MQEVYERIMFGEEDGVYPEDCPEDRPIKRNAWDDEDAEWEDDDWYEGDDDLESAW